MKNQQSEQFIALVVKTIQTNYNSPSDAKDAMESLLNVADDLYFEIKGERIVKRGERSLLETIVSHNGLNKIK